MSGSSNFIKFIQQYRVTDSNNLDKNVVSLPPHKGKWGIPKDRYDEFLRLYAKCIDSKHSMQFVELHEQYGPIVIDLDFKHDHTKKERLYKKEDIDKIIQMYIEEIQEYFNVDSFKHSMQIRRKI